MLSSLSQILIIVPQRYSDEEIKNDPFYLRPLSNPFSQLKKKLSLRKGKRRSTT